MTLEEFKALASPDRLSPPLKALWYDAHGDWNKAHEQVQAGSTPDADWVHAYLHRKEGDLGNARYWYQQAGRVASASALSAEWSEIAGALVRKQPVGRSVLGKWIRAKSPARAVDGPVAR